MPWLFALVCAGYCYWNATERRMKTPALWALFGFFFNLFAIAILHGNRWLKKGESRSGGRGWDSCRWLAINGTIFFVLAGFTGLVNIAGQSPTGGSSPEATGYAIGATIGIAAIFIFWLFLTIGFLVFGLILKKNVEEIGPTGPLAAARLSGEESSKPKKKIEYGKTN